MYCFNCGALLADDAAFCHKCGQPQGAHGRQEQGRWEFCEIVAKSKEGVLRDTYHYEAEAVGPHGPYIAARSREWKEPAHSPRWQVLDNSNERAYAVVKELISQLIKDGWEATGEKGSNWENHRFRRAVSR